ncbi:MAG: LD-carboxypeptidase [Clostridia bacterium]
MKFPEFLKSGDTIAVTALSYGITEECDLLRYKYAVKYFNEMDINVINTPNTFTIDIGASSNAKTRATEFMSLYGKSNAIISASGGETELLVLNELSDLNNCKPTWMLGYSDNTAIIYYLLTTLDTAAIYGYNIGAFGNDPMDKSVKFTSDLLLGKKLNFESSSFFQIEQLVSANTRGGCNFKYPTEWKTLSGKNEKITGRAIGGCLDLLTCIAGTQFDKTKDFINKYKNDGILWFMESCDLNSVAVLRALWQLKNCGWFNYASGYIFGRPFIDSEYCGYNFVSAVKEILGDTLPIIFDADFGHKPPINPIVCGAIMTAECFGNKGRYSFKLL